jgi:hypothetical protein
MPEIIPYLMVMRYAICAGLLKETVLDNLKP